MQKTIAFGLVLLMFVPAAFGDETAAGRIAAMPEGTKIELHLKNKETVRGARGQLSAGGFALVDAKAGERTIAFNDVMSVKSIKSHTTRTVLIVVGVVLVALGIVGRHV